MRELRRIRVVTEDRMLGRELVVEADRVCGSLSNVSSTCLERVADDGRGVVVERRRIPVEIDRGTPTHVAFDVLRVVAHAEIEAQRVGNVPFIRRVQRPCEAVPSP